MKCNLVLHCGGHVASREEIHATSTPEPTSSWTPIAHDYLIESVEKALESHQLEVVQQSHALAKDGDRYFGLMQVQDRKISHSDYCWVLGLRNSHDKSYPVGLVAGSQVFVCDNLSFSGDVKIKRRHTSKLIQDLPRLVTDAASGLHDQWQTNDQRVHAYKDVHLTDRNADHLLIRALVSGVISSRDLKEVLGEWHAPSHSAFEGRHVWSFYNAVTEVLKGNTNRLVGKTQRLNWVCDRFVGFDPNSHDPF